MRSPFQAMFMRELERIGGSCVCLNRLLNDPLYDHRASNAAVTNQ
jgi:hypothetical protein